MDRHHLRVKERKLKLQANTPKKQAHIAILTPDKSDQTKTNHKTQGRTLHTHQRKKIHQENTAVLNIYATNTRELKFIKEILLQLKSCTDPYTLIVGDFNTSLSPINRSYRQRLNREMLFINESTEKFNKERELQTNFPYEHRWKK